MTHLFPNDLLLGNLMTSNLYQAYNQMANYQAQAMNSMILASQEQALRNQLFGMMQMRTQMLQQASFKPQMMMMQPLIDTKIEDCLSSTSNSSGSPLQMNSGFEEQLKVNTAPISKAHSQASQNIPKEVQNLTLVKAQLEEMIYFLLNNLGRMDQAEIEKVRRKYSNNLYLLPIFDNLVSKYYPVKKHREDIIRYVIRRALKYLKNDTIQKDKVYGKRAYAVLCKKYFHFSTEEVEKMGINIEDEKELIEFLLPYRKNSKNRTMNTNFTSEIFSSKEFCADYKKFLDNFDNVLNDDNNKKIEKLISLAEECIAKNCPEKIKRCTRLPWLQVWTEKTREVAFNLLTSEGKDFEEKKDKKVKVETNNSTQPPVVPLKFEGSH